MDLLRTGRKLVASLVIMVGAVSSSFAQERLPAYLLEPEFWRGEPDTSEPTAKPYEALFYENDFSYLNEPDCVSDDRFDMFKAIELRDCLTLDLGGEFRWRYHNEDRLRGSVLAGLSDEFLLGRTRLYSDLKYNNWLRAYAEFLNATSSHEDLPPRFIEENRSDWINLFGEARLWGDDTSGSIRARLGRQELLYGAQRLVSPLDWANTRRTFDGAKLFYSSETWNLEGFWTRPVPFAQHVRNDHNFDNPDQSQQFYGVYSTYKGLGRSTLDLYYLALQEYDRVKFIGAAAVPGDFAAHTIGTRWQGSHCDWLWDLEGGSQFGDFNEVDISAAFYTLGAGYRFSALPWTPTLWTYYDWASGDNGPGGDMSTFNQLFPLGHKYLGYADLVGRQNIESWNFLFTLSPHPRATVLIWYYNFKLEESRDALYNSAGVPIRQDPTGAAGSDVGNELDVVLSMELGRHRNLLIGYSKFFSGDFISNTGISDDADFFYTQLSFRF